ncbi:hypothetical protein C5167_044857, partial [Papaver somniferum]
NCENQDLAVSIEDAVITVGSSDRFHLIGIKKLAHGHCQTSCSNIEALIKDSLLPIFWTDTTAAASISRLLFHDCQVQFISDIDIQDANQGSGYNKLRSDERRHKLYLAE